MRVVLNDSLRRGILPLAYHMGNIVGLNFTIISCVDGLHITFGVLILIGKADKLSHQVDRRTARFTQWQPQ
jgi:hypothetical protein